MRLLIALFLWCNYGIAQNLITVKDQRGNNLAGVSIFQIHTTNSLVGITDSLGQCQLKLQENQKYTFHQVGFIDQTYTASELKVIAQIELQEHIFQLINVNIKPAKFKLITITHKANGFRFGDSNAIKATIESVTMVNLDKPGFIKEFKLFADQNKPGKVRVFRLAIFKSTNGSPGERILKESVLGMIKKDKLIFNVDSLGLFLDAGSYFMGFESTNHGGFTNDGNMNRKELNKIGSFLMIKGGISKQPKLYRRWNLNSWTAYDLPPRKNDILYADMAYEISMQIPLAK